MFWGIFICRYSTAKPHHRRPTYTLFEHSSFRYFEAKKAAEVGFDSFFAAAASKEQRSSALSFDDFITCLRDSGRAMVESESAAAHDDEGGSGSGLI